MTPPDLIHGGALDAMIAAFPHAPRPWLDLSTGISPFAYPVGKLPETTWTRLPDEALQTEARAAAASFFGATEFAVTLAPGSQSVIARLPEILNARSAAIVSPTYNEHASAWPTARTVPDLDAALAAECDAVVLVNPNNPDGRRWPAHAVIEATRVQTARQGWLIVDEAFADFAPELSVASVVNEELNLLALRSFGKSFGLAGLRLGALIAPPDIARRFEAALGPWPVSGPALEIARRAYADRDWFALASPRVHAARDALIDTLETAGLEIEGEGGLFVTVRSPHAADIWRACAEAGVYIRRFADNTERLRFGLPPDAAARARLGAALQETSR